MKNNSMVFDSHIRIEEVDIDKGNKSASDTLDKILMQDWPMNMEVVICKIPIRKRDGYSTAMIQKFANKIKNSVMVGGKVFLIMYAPSEQKSRPFEVANQMVTAGFNHVDNIILEKTWRSGKRTENMLVNSHDYCLYFVNGDTWKIDRTPIKHYLQEKDDSCCGNTWLVEAGGLDDNISDDTSELLLMFSDLLPGSAVFAPFMGNCGILKACLKLGHSLFGYETDKRKLAQYKKILNDYSEKRG